MGINWIAAFKLIPWSEVVAATPTVMRGAKDLWARTKKAKPKSPTTDAVDLPEPGSIADLSRRVSLLETEQFDASALINTLAEQNAQLVAAVDNLRAKFRMLGAACVLLALGGVALWLR